MTEALPVVRRELRLAARRPFTFRSRMGAALVAAFLGALALLSGAVLANPAPGRNLFSVLAFLGFYAGALGGVLLSADALSRERRDGTLPLLLLAEVRPWEIVLGKFLACVLVPWQALLAAFPVLALPLVLGGVTAGEFWRTTFVLALTPAFTAALALAVSARVPDPQRALGTALAVAAAWLALPVAAQALAGGRLTALAAGTLSPLGLFGLSLDEQRLAAAAVRWWPGALLGVIATLAALLLAAGLLNARGPATRRAAGERCRTGWWGRRKAARGVRLREENPVAWLAWHAGWFRRGAAWLGWLGVAGVGLLAVAGYARVEPLLTSLLAPWVIAVLFGMKILAAAQAVYFLPELRRSGALELLMVTPVDPGTLVTGQFAAARHMLIMPYLALFLASALALLLGDDLRNFTAFSRLNVTAELLLSGVDLVAVTCYGVRNALKYPKSSAALLRTVGLGVVLPYLCCGWLRLIVMLILIAQCRQELAVDQRRQLRRWLFPGDCGPVFGAPRTD
jgi:ABC-type transport system involved in multi-copper enzyme maturation permease subunit